MSSKISLNRVGPSPRPVKNRPHSAPPVTRVESEPRVPTDSWLRDWKTRDARYVRQGMLSLYLTNPEVLRPASRGAGGGKARSSYSLQAIALCLVIRAVDDLALRQTEGRVRDLARLLGYTGPTPDHSTLARRMSDSGISAAVADFLREAFPSRGARRAGLVVLIDSTGLTLRAPGRYYAEKHKDKRRGVYKVLHVATDAETGEILAHRLTASTREKNTQGEYTGAEIGDAPVGREIVADLSEVGGVKLLIGDGAYNAKYLFEKMEAQGGRLLAPFPSNAAYNPPSSRGDVLRNESLLQMHTLGEKRWKALTGYHRRSSVEADIGGFKRTMGERLHAVVVERQEVEVAVKVLLYSAWRVMEVAV